MHTSLQSKKQPIIYICFEHFLHLLPTFTGEVNLTFERKNEPYFKMFAFHAKNAKSELVEIEASFR